MPRRLAPPNALPFYPRRAEPSPSAAPLALSSEPLSRRGDSESEHRGGDSRDGRVRDFLRGHMSQDERWYHHSPTPCPVYSPFFPPFPTFFPPPPPPPVAGGRAIIRWFGSAVCLGTGQQWRGSTLASDRKSGPARHTLRHPDTSRVIPPCFRAPTLQTSLLFSYQRACASPPLQRVAIS